MQEFASLFYPTPHIPILDINLNLTALSNSLNNIVEPYEGKIATINTTLLNKIRVKAKRATYDYGVISNSLLDHEDKHKFMELISLAIRDSGYIIIIEEKNKNTDIIYELLEKFDYGAISSIDIFKDFTIIMGMKVHMWGMD